MQGAKGVIISILGGEDMKLLEVDEAANHIRELVDPDANIIWGSAFNPDLEGRIRVSVVATGIEQTTEQAQEAARPLNLSASRGPVLPSATRAPSDPVRETASPASGRVPEPYASAPQSSGYQSDASSDAGDAAPQRQSAYSDDADESAELELGAADEAEAVETAEAESNPTYASLAGSRESREEPLDLGLEQMQPEAEAAAPPPRAQDDLLLDADRLAAEDNQVGAQGARRRGLVSGEAGGAAMPRVSGGEAAKPAQGSAAPASGTTLFERMANLSRSSKASTPEDEEDDDGASSISIPRFLGRQNNQ